MKKHEIEIHNLLKNVVDKAIEHEAGEWPPECALFFYQPERPARELTRENAVAEKYSKKANR